MCFLSTLNLLDPMGQILYPARAFTVRDQQAAPESFEMMTWNQVEVDSGDRLGHTAGSPKTRGQAERPEQFPFALFLWHFLPGSRFARPDLEPTRWAEGIAPT